MRTWCPSITLFTLVCLAGSGCSADAPDSPLAPSAEDARELRFLADVSIIEMSREEFAAEAEARAGNITDESLEEYAATYGRLGFFDMGLDLRPIVAGSSSDWVGAQYWNGQVTLVGEVDDDTLVHELVHALQDQHFDIAAYDLRDTSDGFLARRAVVEGDAVLAQNRFLVREQDGSDLDVIDWRTFLDNWREFALGLVLDSTYPPIFLDYVSFTYPYGLEFSAHNLLGVSYDQPTGAPVPPHDWNLQNQLFTERRPNTTRQILELDIDGVADGPTSNIGLSQVPLALSDRLADLDWDSMGEWSTYLMLVPLEQAGTLPDARAIANRWLADRALFIVDATTGDIGTVWALAFEDQTAATAMAGAMYAIYGAEPPLDGYLSSAANGETVWIETRGSDVVIMRNLAADLGPAMADAAFTGQTAFSPRRRAPLPQIIDRLRQRHTCRDFAAFAPLHSHAGPPPGDFGF